MRKPQCEHAYRSFVTSLNRVASTGESPRGLVVFYAKSGLADKIKGAVTAFYFALLSGRAFKIPGPTWPMIYKSELNWFDSSNAMWYLWRTDVIKRRVECDLQFGKGSDLRALFERGNISDAWTKYHVVFLELCFDWAELLFGNANHRQQLYEMGLTPMTITGCAISFLFDVQAAILLPHSAIIDKIETTRIKIGMHVRLGDRAFKLSRYPRVTSTSLLGLGNFFRCALSIERSLTSRADVVWILMSDSRFVKQVARAHYPDRIVATQFNASHTRDAADVEGWKLAAAEMWMLSQLDYLVITSLSDFGAVAAAASLKQGFVYRTSLHENPPECNAYPTPSWFRGHSTNLIS